MAAAAGACVAFAVGWSACADRPALGDVIEASAGYFPAFEHFERWAARTLQSDVRLRGTQALREAVFAPLRHDSSVLWAEVHSDAGPRLQYQRPTDAAALHFVPIEAPALGRIRVALCESCRGQHPSDRCVVIARPERTGRPRIRMAFCSAPVASQAHASK